MNTGRNHAGLPSSRQRLVVPFRLQPPAALPDGMSGIDPLRVDAIQASPVTRRLAKAAGRIEFAYATDEDFTSGCSPPPLTRTQLPSVTGPPDEAGQGLSPCETIALEGARMRRGIAALGFSFGFSFAGPGASAADQTIVSQYGQPK